MEIKQKLRQEYKFMRSSMDLAKKREFDEEIAKNLMQTESYKKASTIFAYMSSKIEVGTYTLIEKSIKTGKKIALPKCINRTGDMQFYYINAFDDLIIGEFQILEPDTTKCEKAEYSEHSLILVPALSYDFEGYRLGFGKGYYDRYLPNFKGEKIGLCYENCLCKRLPKNEFDVAVDNIITETRMIEISYKRRI